jgi:hypothetical protein
MRPPSRWSFAGSCMNSAISWRSRSASSKPATSSNVARRFLSDSNFARDLVKLTALSPLCLPAL